MNRGSGCHQVGVPVELEIVIIGSFKTRTDKNRPGENSEIRKAEGGMKNAEFRSTLGGPNNPGVLGTEKF